MEGSGFEPGGTPVNVYWGGESSGVVLASLTTASGSFSLDVTIPANAAAGHDYLLSAIQATNPQHQGGFVFRTSLAADPVPSSPVAAAPVVQPQPAAQAEPAPAPAPQIQAAPAPQPAAAPSRAADPKTSPVDASGFAGVSPFASGQPVAPLVVDQRQAFSGPVHSSPGRSPWLLVPLALVGLTVFAGAAASAVRQARPQGIRATV